MPDMIRWRLPWSKRALTVWMNCPFHPTGRRFGNGFIDRGMDRVCLCVSLDGDLEMGFRCSFPRERRMKLPRQKRHEGEACSHGLRQT